MAALQRAGIQSLLKAAPYPHLSLPVPSAEERLDAALRRGHLDHGGALKPELLTSTALAPTLLRPISTPRALLSSHTLRHTFRNPHIAALSKTALDLRESEGTLGRALGRCFADMERSVLPDSMRPSDMPPDSLQMLPYNPPFLYVDTRGGPFTHRAIDADAIGADGTNLTADELNPSFERLDPLFVTSNGLPIPLGSDPNTIQPNGVPHEENDQSGLPPPAQAVLSPIQQRDVVRAALDCLHELATDSREYVERLDEVRARLAAVKRERTRVWQALRRWALDKEEETTTADEATANDASGTGEKHSSTLNEHASNQVSTARGNQRAAAKDKSTSSAANASGSTRKKARTAAS
ncbi:hypothetical protein IE81DRAFT_81716 [Ceraceosorus guamensis]|uniref:Transcriptional regulatory protein RXT2 N-terminal domain-containing protein n=1 Tax=Ceraceosorus guamensis TaxID=1522189 RepID=A0A316W892_9BASI|nr:hypothetical protein IE81DRAFT_81716 [Ceraceosorus guamensis]PWN46052.1 hypothetical protein IE81DRAFT_81716 [Ceraceosorus guamensis]